MENSLNNVLKGILIVCGILTLAYGAYLLYHIAIDDATKKIRAGVSKGVQEGVGQSLNPFNAVGNMFGGGKK